MPKNSATPTTQQSEETKARINRESLRTAARLFAYLLPYKAIFVAALFALLFSSLLSLAFPYITGMLVDRAIAGPTAVTSGLLQAGINTIVLALLAALGLQAVFSFFPSVCLMAVVER